MPAYEVVAIDKTDAKPDTGRGISISEDLRVKDPSGEVVSVNLWRPKTHAPSTVGQVYEGKVRVDPQWGPKLELDKKPGGGGGFKGPRPLAEEQTLQRQKDAAINARAALNEALVYTQAMAGAGRLPEDFNAGVVEQIAQRFHVFLTSKGGV